MHELGRNDDLVRFREATDTVIGPCCNRKKNERSCFSTHRVVHNRV